MCAHTHTHTRTHSFSLYLSIPIQRIYHLNYSYFVMFWLCGKAVPLFFLFKICSALYIFFQRKFTVCLSNSTGKTLQETSTTAQDRITDKRLDLPSYLQLLPHNPNKTYGTSFTEHQEMKDSNLPDTGNKLSKP